MPDYYMKAVIIQAGDNPRPQGFEAVAVLAPEHRPVAPLPYPLTNVVADGIAKHAVQGLGFAGNLAGVFTDNHPQLALRLYRPGAFRGHHNILLGADDGVHRAEVRLRKLGVIRLGSPAAGHTLHVAAVVGPGGVEHRRDDRGQQPHLAQSVGYAGIGGRRRPVRPHRAARHLNNLIIHYPAITNGFSQLKAAPNHSYPPRYIAAICPDCGIGKAGRQAGVKAGALCYHRSRNADGRPLTGPEGKIQAKPTRQHLRKCYRRPQGCLPAKI